MLLHTAGKFLRPLSITFNDPFLPGESPTCLNSGKDCVSPMHLISGTVNIDSFFFCKFIYVEGKRVGKGQQERERESQAGSTPSQPEMGLDLTNA